MPVSTRSTLSGSTFQFRSSRFPEVAPAPPRIRRYWIVSLWGSFPVIVSKASRCLQFQSALLLARIFGLSLCNKVALVSERFPLSGVAFGVPGAGRDHFSKRFVEERLFDRGQLWSSTRNPRPPSSNFCPESCFCPKTISHSPPRGFPPVGGTRRFLFFGLPMSNDPSEIRRLFIRWNFCLAGLYTNSSGGKRCKASERTSINGHTSALGTLF